jgi:hypothetical protein
MVCTDYQNRPHLGEEETTWHNDDGDDYKLPQQREGCNNQLELKINPIKKVGFELEIFKFNILHLIYKLSESALEPKCLLSKIFIFRQNG